MVSAGWNFHALGWGVVFSLCLWFGFGYRLVLDGGYLFVVWFCVCSCDSGILVLGDGMCCFVGLC